MIDRQRVKEIVADALEHGSQERVSFVQQACGDDAPLRTEVNALLDLAAEASVFLLLATRVGIRIGRLDLQVPAHQRADEYIVLNPASGSDLRHASPERRAAITLTGRCDGGCRHRDRRRFDVHHGRLCTGQETQKCSRDGDG